ncbi:hypothetical protein EW145_g3227 [Phellinidium pouzarii]|uniref:Protein kinase domain-containing protein n=1 Tax=Phellinidium pouzarii TaxID=167371 RepID=A0A4S4L853_9AGAM|nr:hypothetical protein EW145_g3227 [Phellinidium pouzarii]
MMNGNASKLFEGQDTQDTMPERIKLVCCLSSTLRPVTPVSTATPIRVQSVFKAVHTFSPTIIHGDLKASNVLIDDNGLAMLSDFGISTLIGNVSGSTRFTTTTFAGCVMTGKIPYFYLRNDVQVIKAIMNGARPAREAIISEELWTLLQTCWREDPATRHSISLIKNIMDDLLLASTRMDRDGCEVRFDEPGRRSPEDQPQSSELLSTKQPSVDDFGVIIIVKNFGTRRINLSIFIGDQIIFEEPFVPPIARTLPLKINTPYYIVLESEGRSRSSVESLDTIRIWT